MAPGYFIHNFFFKDLTLKIQSQLKIIKNLNLRSPFLDFKPHCVTYLRLIYFFIKYIDNKMSYMGYILKSFRSTMQITLLTAHVFLHIFLSFCCHLFFATV